MQPGPGCCTVMSRSGLSRYHLRRMKQPPTTISTSFGAAEERSFPRVSPEVRSRDRTSALDLEHARQASLRLQRRSDRRRDLDGVVAPVPRFERLKRTGDVSALASALFLRTS